MDPLSFFKKAKKADINRGFLESFRKDLLSYMKSYPEVPAEAPRLGPARAFGRFATVPALVGLISVLTVGGTAFASQRSLPGDFLYPVKLLSEEVRVAVALTPEARSEARLTFAATRVEEVSKLAEESANESSTNSNAYHAAMQAALGNFNAQIAGVFADASNLKENNNATGSRNITSQIKDATDDYRALLASGRDKSNDGNAEDMNQFIHANNGFNERAQAELLNVSGTGTAIAPAVSTSSTENGRQGEGSDHRSSGGGEGNGTVTTVPAVNASTGTAGQGQNSENGANRIRNGSDDGNEHDRSESGDGEHGATIIPLPASSVSSSPSVAAPTSTSISTSTASSSASSTISTSTPTSTVSSASSTSSTTSSGSQTISDHGGDTSDGKSDSEDDGGH